MRNGAVCLAAQIWMADLGRACISIIARYPLIPKRDLISSLLVQIMLKYAGPIHIGRAAQYLQGQIKGNIHLPRDQELVCGQGSPCHDPISLAQIVISALMLYPKNCIFRGRTIIILLPRIGMRFSKCDYGSAFMALPLHSSNGVLNSPSLEIDISSMDRAISALRGL